MTDFILDWQNKKDSHYKKNKKTIQKLKQHKSKALDRFAGQLHEQVFEKIDCLDCANCCSGIPPIVNKTDAARIAKKLGIAVAEFETTYLTIDEDKDTVMNQSPCPFLLPNRYCSIYEFRPKACREYPHTDSNFSAHLDYHATHTKHCPATFHIVEQLKNSIP